MTNPESCFCPGWGSNPGPFSSLMFILSHFTTELHLLTDLGVYLFLTKMVLANFFVPSSIDNGIEMANPESFCSGWKVSTRYFSVFQFVLCLFTTLQSGSQIQ
jgi:hypothetical protein